MTETVLIWLDISIFSVDLLRNWSVADDHSDWTYSSRYILGLHTEYNSGSRELSEGKRGSQRLSNFCAVKWKEIE